MMRRQTDRVGIAFYIPREVAVWLAQLARDAGDADADAAARGLIARIAAEDMAAEGPDGAGAAGATTAAAEGEAS